MLFQTPQSFIKCNQTNSFYRQFNFEDKDGLVPWRVGFLKIPLYKNAIVEAEDPNKPVKKELTPLESFTLRAREKLKLFIFRIFFKHTSI